MGSGAGGAADRQARVVQKHLQTFPDIPGVIINNRPGGAGNVAYIYLAQHPGDAHYLITMSTNLVTSQIAGTSQLGYRDFTPLNILVREYIAVWVRNQSPIATGKELMAILRKDPTAISFAFATARGNQNHIVIGMLAKAAGADPKSLKIVVYPSGGQGMTAAIGGHVDVWVGTAGSAQNHQQAGTVRILGLSASQRQAGRLAAVPDTARAGHRRRVFCMARVRRTQGTHRGPDGILGPGVRETHGSRGVEERTRGERLGRGILGRRGDTQAPRRGISTAAAHAGRFGSRGTKVMSEEVNGAMD